MTEGQDGRRDMQYHLGAAVVAVDKADEANAYMERQGYGPKTFSVEVGPEGQPASALLNFQPLGRDFAITLQKCLELFQGDFIPLEDLEPAQQSGKPRAARTALDRKLLRLGLKIRTRETRRTR